MQTKTAFGVLLGLGLSVAGCSPAPNFDDRISEGARQSDFPSLIAVDPILEAHGGPVEQAPEAAALEARAEALKRKAEASQQGPVIDAETLRRLEAAREAAAAQGT